MISKFFPLLFVFLLASTVSALPKEPIIVITSEQPNIYNLTSEIVGDLAIKIIVADLYNPRKDRILVRRYRIINMLKIFINPAHEFEPIYYQYILSKWVKKMQPQKEADVWRIIEYSEKSDFQPYTRVRWVKRI